MTVSEIPLSRPNSTGSISTGQNAVLPSDSGKCRFIPQLIQKTGTPISQTVLERTACLNPDLITGSLLSNLEPGWAYSVIRSISDGNRLVFELEHDGPENASVTLTSDLAIYETTIPQRTIRFHIAKEKNAEALGKKNRLQVTVDLDEEKYKPLRTMTRLVLDRPVQTQLNRKIQFNFEKESSGEPLSFLWREPVEPDGVNPDIIPQTATIFPSWQYFIYDIDYDARAGKITVFFMSNCPKETPFFLIDEGISTDASSPGKILKLYIPNKGEAPSEALMPCRNFTLDLNQERYRSLISENPVAGFLFVGSAYGLKFYVPLNKDQ